MLIAPSPFRQQSDTAYSKPWPPLPTHTHQHQSYADIPHFLHEYVRANGGRWSFDAIEVPHPDDALGMYTWLDRRPVEHIELADSANLDEFMDGADKTPFYKPTFTLGIRR
jgi:hypothetical protein